MPTLNFVADITSPNPTEIVKFTASGYGTNVTLEWYFYNSEGTRIYPSSIEDPPYIGREINVSFVNLGDVTVILDTYVTPGITYESLTKTDYINISSQNSNYLYSLVRNDLDLVTLTTTGYKDIEYKVTQLDPSTIQETIITDWTYVYIADADDYLITFTDDGVYFIYVRYGTTNVITCKYIVVNVKLTKTYLETQSLDAITCTPSNDNVYPAFANKDYIYNVVSNMYFTFLGVEFEDIAFNYETIGTGCELIFNKKYTPVTISTSIPDWRNENGICCLEREDGLNFDFNSPLTTDVIYKCVATGTPTNYAGYTITATTNEVNTYLENIAGSLYRINQYLITV